MKKRVVNFIVIGVVLLLCVNLVSAGPLQDLVNGISDGITYLFENSGPVLKLLFGDSANLDTSLDISSVYISRIFFFLIIFSLVYITLNKIEFISENRAIFWIVTLAVTFLATRFMTMTGVVESLLLPYDALGVTFAAFLPLILFFVFIEVGLQGVKSIFLRKSAWITFAVVFVFFWFIRYDEMVGIGVYTAWIYPVCALCCFIFFWFDGAIQKWIAKSRVISKVQEKVSRQRILSLYEELEGLERARRMGETKIGSHLISTRVKQIYDEIAAISGGAP